MLILKNLMRLEVFCNDSNGYAIRRHRSYVNTHRVIDEAWAAAFNKIEIIWELIKQFLCKAYVYSL